MQFTKNHNQILRNRLLQFLVFESTTNNSNLLLDLHSKFWTLAHPLIILHLLDFFLEVFQRAFQEGFLEVLKIPNRRHKTQRESNLHSWPCLINGSCSSLLTHSIQSSLEMLFQLLPCRHRYQRNHARQIEYHTEKGFSTNTDTIMVYLSLLLLVVKL